MNKILRWTGFLVIGIVVGFMVSLLFNNGEEVASTDQTQAVEETEATSSEETPIAADTDVNDESTTNGDNILVQKGCIQCHAVSPIGETGNGTAPDLAIAYEDVKKRFGKSLEEFMVEPEGTMSAVFGASPLTEEEQAEIINLIKEYNE